MDNAMMRVMGSVFTSIMITCVCLSMAGCRYWRTSPSNTLLKYLSYDIYYGHDVWRKTFGPQPIDPDFKIDGTGTCALNTFMPYLPNDYDIFLAADTKGESLFDHSIRKEIDDTLNKSNGAIELIVQQGWRTLVPKTEIPFSRLKLSGNYSYYLIPLAKVPMEGAVVEMPITVKVTVKRADPHLQTLLGQISLIIDTSFHE